MRAIICLVIFLAIVQTNIALKCYTCLGSRQSDCSGNDAATKVIQSCVRSTDKKMEWFEFEEHSSLKNPNPAQEILAVCVKLDAEDSVNISNLMQRGCAFTYDNVDICEYIISTNPSIRNCEWCSDDLCNM